MGANWPHKAVYETCSSSTFCVLASVKIPNLEIPGYINQNACVS